MRRKEQLKAYAMYFTSASENNLLKILISIFAGSAEVSKPIRKQLNFVLTRNRFNFKTSIVLVKNLAAFHFIAFLIRHLYPAFQIMAY